MGKTKITYDIRHISRTVIFSLVLFFPTLNFAQNKYAGEFLAIGVGARSQGIGAAFVALADDATATYWNPAGLGQITYPKISLMHAEQFGGEINYDFASVAIPFRERTTFGLGIIRLGVDGIPDTRDAFADLDKNGNGIIDDDERPDVSLISFFSNTDYAFFFSTAYKKTANLYYGGNVKFIRRNLGDNTAWGIGFDISAFTKLGENLSIGVNAMDITTTTVVWDTGEKQLITPTLKIGGAYTWDAEFLPLTFIPVIDADLRFEGRDFASRYNVGTMSIDPHYGLEVGFNNSAFFRTGYDDLKRVSFGLGLRMPKLIVDYSFSSFDDFDELGNTHRISLSLTIEEEKFKRSR